MMEMADACWPMQKRKDRFPLQKLHKHGFLKLWGSVPGPSEKYFSVQLKKKRKTKTKTNKQTNRQKTDY